MNKDNPDKDKQRTSSVPSFFKVTLFIICLWFGIAGLAIALITFFG